MKESAPPSKAPVQLVPMVQIDQVDDTFATSPDWVINESLLGSIERVGVTNPLLLHRNGTDRLRIVCGFQRHRLARKLGLCSLPVRITEEDDPRALFDLALFENLGTRVFSDLEKALAVKKLAGVSGLSEEEILTGYFPALDVRADHFHYKRCQDIARLPRRIQKHLSLLRVEIALKLTRWTGAEQRFFLDLIETYAPSRSYQKKLFELLDDLRARGNQRGEQTPLADVWSATGCLQLHENAPPGEAATFREILVKLQQNRYPEMAKITSAYEHAVKSLSLSRRVRVTPPPFFEGDSLTFQFSARSAQELAGIARHLEKAARAPEMGQIFDLL